MTATETETSRLLARRTGATWVAATGAFLLLAAATAFVATRWSDIPDAVKLAVLVGLTGAAVLSGDRLRRTLPATGNALFHLGALLIPVDIAALGLHIGMEWPELLLVNGAVSAGALTLLAARCRSVVLAGAASAAVMVTAAGVGATTAIPAPLALAVAAVAACWYTRTERHAWVWASVAGLAPVMTLAVQNLVVGHGVAENIGVLAVTPWYAAAAAGLLSAGVIARAARRRNEPALTLLAAGALVAQGIAAWNATTVPSVMEILAAPSLFVVVQFAVLLARRDAFWRKPAEVAGIVVEALAAIPTAIAALAALLLVVNGEPQGLAVVIAAVLMTIGWFVAGVRRDDVSRSLRASIVEGPQWPFAIPATFAWALAAIAAATADPTAVAGATLLLAVGVGFSTLPNRMPTVCGLGAFALLAGAADERVVAVACGTGLVIALAMSRGTRTFEDRLLGFIIGAALLAVGEIQGFGTTPPALAAVGWIATVWLLALAYDMDGEVNGFTRGLAFVPIAFAAVISPEAALAPAVLLFVLAAGEGVLRKQQELTIAAVAPLLWLQFVGAALSGLSIGAAGLALTVAACVWFGFATLVHGSHRLPLEIAGVATAVAGVLTAAATPETFGPALLVLGGTGVAIGLARSSALIAHIGGAVATLGIWVTLDTHDVVFAELYVAPVALQLLAAGYAARRDSARHVSSWIAYAPGIALIAGAALAERFAGGGPYHSLIAGTVGVIAVVAGGRFRLSAPLVLGTATLVVVVARETFDTAAGIPPWAWLAAGGVTLIGAAVAMERNDVGPIEAGKRVVDVMATHFE